MVATQLKSGDLGNGDRRFFEKHRSVKNWKTGDGRAWSNGMGFPVNACMALSNTEVWRLLGVEVHSPCGHLYGETCHYLEPGAYVPISEAPDWTTVEEEPELNPADRFWNEYHCFKLCLNTERAVAILRLGAKMTEFFENRSVETELNQVIDFLRNRLLGEATLYDLQVALVHVGAFDKINVLPPHQGRNALARLRTEQLKKEERTKA